jgi:hypothetical protein
LDWDINTGYRWKILTDRSDWVIKTARHYTQRRHRRQKQPQLPPSDPHVSNRRSKPPLIRSGGAGTTAPKRATAVQDPSPQCCCTHADHLTAWRTLSPKQPNARGPRHIHRWTPSRVRGHLQPATRHASLVRGTFNPLHDSTLRIRSKNCRRGSKKRCPIPQNCDNPPRKILYYRLRPIHFGH